MEEGDLQTPDFNLTAFKELLQFLPKDHATLLRDGIAEALYLYITDRHYEVVAKLQGLKEECAALETELAQRAVELTSPPVISPSGASGGSSGDESSPRAATALSATVIRSFLENSVMFKTSCWKVEECEKLSKEVDDMTSWKPTTSIDEKGYGTYYRKEEGKASHSFKVIGEVAQSILYMASVIMELDLYTEWFPFCNEAMMQGEVNRFHKSSRFVISCPWPLANREVFLVGFGVDDLQHRRRVLITASSPKEDEPLHPNIKRPAVGKGCTRIPVEVGGFVIEALSAQSCKVSFIMNVDPQIAHVPQFLVNWVSGKMIWVLLYQMEKAAKRAKDKKSKYAERRLARPDIYVHFTQRAMEVYRHHFPDEEVAAFD